MTEGLEVYFTPRASEHIAKAKDWWLQNRTKAPQALREDLDTALELISTHPGIGEVARNVRLAGVRRVYLNRVRYYLYYRIHEGSMLSIEVVAFWHASRGSGPGL